MLQKSPSAPLTPSGPAPKPPNIQSTPVDETMAVCVRAPGEPLATIMLGAIHENLLVSEPLVGFSAGSA